MRLEIAIDSAGSNPRNLWLSYFNPSLFVLVEDAGKKLNKPQTPIDAQISPGDVIATNTDDDGLGHWELISFES